MDAPPNIVLHNNVYRYVSKLGSGGIGSVYKYTRNGVNVAIKFTSDARHTVLEHKIYRKIVQIGCQKYFANYYFGGVSETPVLHGGKEKRTRTETSSRVRAKQDKRTFRGYPFIAMQLLDTDVLEWSKRYMEAPWYYEECLKIILRATMALQCLWKKGLLYNDLKLDNVLLKLDSDGKPTTIKLGDVGCVAKPGRRPCFTPNFTIFGHGSIITERLTLQSFIISLIDLGYRYGGRQVLQTAININTHDVYYDNAFALMYFITGVIKDFSPLIKFVYTLVGLQDRFKSPSVLYKLASMVLKKSNPQQSSFIARVGRRSGNQVPMLVQWQKKRSLDLVHASLEGNVKETKRLIDIGAAGVELAAEEVASSPDAKKEVFNIFKDQLSSDSAERAVLSASKKNNTDIVWSALHSVDNTWDPKRMNESLNTAAMHGNTKMVALIANRAKQLGLRPVYNLFYAMKGGRKEMIISWLKICGANKVDVCILNNVLSNKPVAVCSGHSRCNWKAVLEACVKHDEKNWAINLSHRFPVSDATAEYVAFHGMIGVVQTILAQTPKRGGGRGGAGGIGGVGGVGGGDDDAPLVEMMMKGALEGGQLAIVKLLEPHADIDYNDALADAIANETSKNFEVVDYLIGRGAEDLSYAALQALQSGNPRMFEFIVDKMKSEEKNNEFWKDAYMRANMAKNSAKTLDGLKRIVGRETFDRLAY